MSYSYADSRSALAQLQSLHACMKGFGNAVRDPTAGIKIGMRQQHTEFIASESRGHIDFTTGIPEHVTHRLEDFITLLVTQRIVQCLEAIEIDHHEAQ